MSRCRCTFEFYEHGAFNRHTVVTDKGAGHFMQGFWVNDQFQLSIVSKHRYWIPPARILHITLLEEL